MLFVTTESPKMRARLENDLIKGLRELTSQYALGELLNVVVATNHQAKNSLEILGRQRDLSNEYKTKVPPEPIPPHLMKRFMKLQKKTNGHFFIWGQLNEREEGENQYIFQSNALIVHPALLPRQIQRLLREFRWEGEIRFAAQAEYTGMKVTAKTVFVITNYIIGTVAAMSGNTVAAAKIHEALLDSIQQVIEFPNIQAIQKNLLPLIAEEHFLLAVDNYYAENIQQTYFHLEKALSYNKRFYNPYILLARLQFLNEENPKKALKTIQTAKSLSMGDGQWRYSQAFLEIYLEDYKKAYHTYSEIISHTFAGEEDTLLQVLEFNINLAKEREFLPSYFIISFLKYKKEGNLPEAYEYIIEFLDKAHGEAKYRYLIEKAETLRKEIENGMYLTE